MTALADRHCSDCRPAAALDAFAIDRLLAQLHEAWRVIGAERIERQLEFPDFARALEFVNIAGAIAEGEGHHPDLLLGWGRVRIALWTHSVGGLSESDFILAAKLDRAYEAAADGDG